MDEYVYLFSNFNALKYYGKPNKIGEFKNQLSCNLPVQQNWKCALTEIIYTKSWYNVLNDHLIEIYDEMGNKLDFSNEIRFCPGFYKSVPVLIEKINHLLKQFPGIIPPHLDYDPIDNYVSLYAGRSLDDVRIFPDLGEELEYMLGLRNRNTFVYEYSVAQVTDGKFIFKNLDVFNNDVLKAFHPAEINGGIHYLCVYCDVVTESYVGDTKSQLLRIVEIPKKFEHGDTVHIRYLDRNYKRIFTDKFQSIEISIRDSSNRLIPFQFGQCTAVLHFKNR